MYLGGRINRLNIIVRGMLIRNNLGCILHMEEVECMAVDRDRGDMVNNNRITHLNSLGMVGRDNRKGSICSLRMVKDNTLCNLPTETDRDKDSIRCNHKG